MKWTKDLLIACCMLAIWGCYSSHDIKTEHKVEPIEINVTVTIKVQDDLRQKFKKQDNIASEISDKDAEKALEEYMNSGQ